MLNFFFKTIVRGLLKNKTNSIINILSLSFGIAFSGIIFLFIRYESTFDHHHSKADRIYRVNTHMQNTDDLLRSPFTPHPLAEALRHAFPDELMVTQIMGRLSGQMMVHPGTDQATLFEDGAILYVDSLFTETFDFTWLAGDPKSALKTPNAVVFHDQMADKLFSGKPYDEIVGEVVTLNDHISLTVTGIIKHPPLNSNFVFSTLISYDTFYKANQDILEDNWESLSRKSTFITLHEHVTPDQIQGRLDELVKNHVSDEDLQQRMSFHLLPLKDLHFAYEYRKATSLYTIPPFLLWPIAGIGMIIILVACMNFVNLATAQAITRAKEVGIRKVLGSKRRHLFIQFMGETALLTLMALLIGLGVGELAVNYFHKLVPFIYLRFGVDYTLIYFIFFITVAVILLAGTYPALGLSRYNPIKAIHHARNMQSGGLKTRKALVVAQFLVAQFFIMCTVGLTFQFVYLSKRAIGFDKDGIITLSIYGHDEAYLRNELLKNKGIQKVSFSSGTPISGEIGTTFSAEAHESVEQKPVLLKYVDSEFFKMFNINLIAGHDFEDRSAHSQEGLIINEALVREIGMNKPEEALGQYLTLAKIGKSLPVIGVVQDYSNRTFEAKGNPEAFVYQPEKFSTVNVKTYGSNIPEVTAFLEKIWKKRYPKRVFTYTFMDDIVKNRLGEDKLFMLVFCIFSGIAIFICCLGLFGLVSFIAMQKQKEVGIRKVLGASARSIVLLFNKSFVKLILIAFVLAAPLSYLLLQSFLQTNTYKITLGPWIFLIGLVATLLIAFTTTGYKSWRAAIANPVDSLRDE